MLKSKGLFVGAAFAVIACALLIGGFAVTSTQGAGTDVPVVTNPGTPPQSPVEVPAVPIIDPGIGVNPDGTVGGNNGGPGGTSALPNAGYGTTGSDSVITSLVFLAAAGIGLVLAGGAVVAARRRD